MAAMLVAPTAGRSVVDWGEWLATLSVSSRVDEWAGMSAEQLAACWVAQKAVSWVHRTATKMAARSVDQLEDSTVAETAALRV